MRELLTGYGPDRHTSCSTSPTPTGLGRERADDWGSEELLAMIRELQPGIIVNDRLDIAATS